MPIKDYYGIEGFCVDIKSAQDVFNALDRIDSQLSDEMDVILDKNEIKRLEEAQQIIGEAMMKLIDIEGVRA